MPVKITYQEALKFVDSHNCKLLTTESEYYNKNCLEKLRFQCHCGKEYEQAFYSFRTRKIKQCPSCGKAMSRNHSFEYVAETIKQVGKSILLSTEFDHIRAPMLFECHLCGVVYEKTYWSYMRGRNKDKACPKCNRKLMHERIRKTGQERYGHLPPEQKSEFDRYYIKVKSISERNYRKYKDIINPDNLPRRRGRYQLDHKFSIKEGFKQNVSPKVIGDYRNLQMLSEYENNVKNDSCSISLEDLS